jgi:hypothetical protein
MVALQENVPKVNYTTSRCVINFIQPLEVVSMGVILSQVGDRLAY